MNDLFLIINKRYFFYNLADGEIFQMSQHRVARAGRALESEAWEMPLRTALFLCLSHRAQTLAVLRPLFTQSSRDCQQLPGGWVGTPLLYNCAL